ncbi:hypothetical protein [Halomonas sp. DQ26W]|nr:hypothetical protein [Halomonas sp. DQ26W]
MDEHKDLLEGLPRELAEEFRPHYKPQFELMHMHSFFYHAAQSANWARRV